MVIKCFQINEFYILILNLSVHTHHDQFFPYINLVTYMKNAVP